MRYFHHKTIIVLVLAILVLYLDIARADLNFGVTPYLAEEQMRESFEPLLQAMSKYLGQKVNLVIARDYGDLAEKMQIGIVDLGAFSPFAYVEAVETVSVQIFAMHLVEDHPNYKGLIIARKEKGYKNISQLENTVFAFVDPKSASGFLYPRAMLIKQGKDPDLFFNKTIFAGSHDKVIKNVLDGKVDGGATYDGAFKLASQQGIPTNQLVILSETEPIPYDAYTARKDLPIVIIKKVQEFFLSLSKDKEPLKSMLAKKTSIKFTGWVEADDSKYNVVRDTAALSKRKKKIATWKFTTNDSEFRNQKFEDVASEMLSNYIAESKRFTVVPQPMLEQALFKYNLGLEGDIRKEALDVLNKKLQLDIVFAGKLSKIGNKVILDISGYDTQTGNIIFNRSVEGSGIEDLDKLITKLTLLLQSEMPLESYIVNVENKLITISGGTEDGFKKGMQFAVVNLAESIWDSGHTKILGRKRRIVGQGVFKELKKDIATGEVTSGDLGQIDVGSRIRTIEADASAFAKQNEVYSLYIQGIGLIAKGYNQKAVEFFEKASDADPLYAMAHAKLSTAYFNLGNRNAGFERLNKAKELMANITFQERNYILAREATEKKNFPAAISYYQNILERYNNTAALHNIGMIFMDSNYKNHNYDKAIDYFKKALSFDSTLAITQAALEKAQKLKKGQGGNTNLGNAVDIAIVFDTTGSMGDEINGMINITQKFADTLSQNQIDFQLGLVSFGDEIRNVFGTDTKKNPVLTSDVYQFKEWLKGLKAEGGNDEPENPFDAMANALKYQFRSNTKTILILITDAPAHMNDQYTKLNTEKMIDLLNKADAKVFIVGVRMGYYLNIATKTGGKFYNIHSDSDFTEIIEQIGKDIIGLF
ncbi:MAG: phosphate/phosphite/phosphonate ABC transporter substrate-binding protein [Desulfobacterales bacterium]|nr:phosphate/phosphite/phosphonate ABC transporter substrate-binding protein [Desulfobacterales bacterium]